MLKLLSWNLFLIPRPIKFTKQNFRLNKIIETLQNSNHDLYLFQEAFGNKTKGKIIEALKKTHPFSKSLEDRNYFWQILDSGLLIISRYPLTVLGFEIFKSTIFTDRFAAKGVLLVELTLPDKTKIQVANTHLQAIDMPEAATVRKSQLYQIKKLFDRNNKNNIPQILIGDLNISGPNSSELTNALSILEMTNYSLIGELKNSHGFLTSAYHHSKKTIMPKCIDHVWMRAKNKVTINEQKLIEYNSFFEAGLTNPLSDHHALEAHVTYLDENNKDDRLKAEEDYYFNDEGLMVFTKAYHLKRGYCCKKKCRHCPYF